MWGPPTPPTPTSNQGPLQPLADAIKKTLNETGEALESRGQRTMGQHILAFLDARKEAGWVDETPGQSGLGMTCG